MNNWSAHFPALSHKVHGQPLTFLDSAASAQKPQAVIDALTHALSGPYANVHRGLYHNSAATTAAFEAARTTLTQFLHADEHGLIFTRNATEGLNLIAQTWGRTNLKKGDTITLTTLEHHAAIVPWQLLQSEIGFTIKVIPLDILRAPTAQNLKPYLQNSNLLSITQMSNVTGERPDLATILPLAQQHGCTIVVDGSQAAAHHPQNLKLLGADFYVCTGHKLYGPTGIGLLWGKPEILTQLPPYQGGGDMIETVSWSGTTYAPPPARFEAGTPAITEAIALAAAANFITTLGWSNIQTHEHALAQKLSQELIQLDFLTLYSPTNTGIVSFNLTNIHPSDAATLLDQQGIAVRSGHHCAMPLMKDLGITGCLRASLALYNTEDDIQRLTAALKKTHGMLK